ncbi:acyltransferase [Hymenobacter chitinivorans]|uniref:Galactoside O-acetyltransferase n=1 Tax=Hymenobacter chitinivorans DSM 11115 TaxID=1121954 RepID=A0A2M9BM02_9BACT|nr:acyltransferase [Hymenobacter chitinivorans]PJJ58987.1 galactoside O-acetyltransferase [Hymenobacter chitinivorans DSM 11115]
MIGYYSPEELAELGFAEVGENVKISKTATIYNTGLISIGSNVRIDNFCVIAVSGTSRLRIGSYSHISAFNFINGMGDITLGDFFTTAPYVRIFSSSDDYSGEHMANTMVPREAIGTESAPVVIQKHVLIGTGSTILQGVTLAEGTAVAAHALVTKSTEPFTLVGGVPARKLKDRSRNLLELEKKYFHGNTEG